MRQRIRLVRLRQYARLLKAAPRALLTYLASVWQHVDLDRWQKRRNKQIVKRQAISVSNKAE